MFKTDFDDTATDYIFMAEDIIITIQYFDASNLISPVLTSATQLPVFACSWKLLYIGSLRERQRAACMKLFHTLQYMRSKKMLEGFPHRGGGVLHVSHSHRSCVCSHEHSSWSRGDYSGYSGLKHGVNVTVSS